MVVLMSNKAAKEAKLRKLIETVEKSRRPASIVAVILGLATLLGGIAAAVTLLPRVTLSVSDPPNVDDPFSSSITVTNTGYLPLNSVAPAISWDKIVFQGPNGPVTLLGNGSKQAFNVKNWPSRDLGLDEALTVALNDVFIGNRQSLISAQITVTVKYEIPVIHFQREKRFPLVAKRQTNNDFYWYRDTPPNLSN
jgi:hypothetical protein